MQEKVKKHMNIVKFTMKSAQMNACRLCYIVTEYTPTHTHHLNIGTLSCI